MRDRWSQMMPKLPYCISRSAAVNRFSASSSRFMLERQCPMFSLSATLKQKPSASAPSVPPAMPLMMGIRSQHRIPSTNQHPISMVAK